MSVTDGEGAASQDGKAYVLQIYPRLSLATAPCCTLRVPKDATAASVIKDAAAALALDASRCYVLAEVKECGGEEWVLEASDLPVQRVLLWPRKAQDRHPQSEGYYFLLQERNRDGSILYVHLPATRQEEEARRLLARGFLPPRQEEYADLCNLPRLTEAAILDNLRNRFHKEKIYTYAGSILIAINPFKFLPIYNPKYVKMYENHQLGKLEPHIFAIADVAYYTMLRKRVNQCIVISGESGSGKTQSTNFLIHCLTALSQKGYASGVERTILGAGPVLEGLRRQTVCVRVCLGKELRAVWLELSAMAQREISCLPAAGFAVAASVWPALRYPSRAGFSFTSREVAASSFRFYTAASEDGVWGVSDIHESAPRAERVKPLWPVPLGLSDLKLSLVPLRGLCDESGRDRGKRAFGNAKTAHNNNSSRFGKFIQVNYLESGVVRGAVVEKYLLEKSRLVSREKNERNYHVFYYLLLGASEEEREEFKLLQPEDYLYLKQQNFKIEDEEDLQHDFERLQQAMEMVGFLPSTKKQIFSVLSAILYLGNVTYKRKSTGRDEGLDVGPPEVLSTLSELLKVKEELLVEALTKRKTVTANDKLILPYSHSEAITARDSMAKSLYSALFDWIVLRINHALLNKKDMEESVTCLSIGVLDIFGFEDFENNSFEQFCINYANEQLQYYFNQHIFKLEQEEYKAEGISWHNIEYTDNVGCIHLISKKPTGLFYLLDEESNFPHATDKTLLAKFKQQHQSNGFFVPTPVMEPAFVIQHFAGTVKYQIKDFREKNTDYMRPDIVALLRSSDRAYVRELIGMCPVAMFRWGILRATIRSIAAFCEAGRRWAAKTAGRPSCPPGAGLDCSPGAGWTSPQGELPLLAPLTPLPAAEEPRWAASGVVRRGSRTPLGELQRSNTAVEKMYRRGSLLDFSFDHSEELPLEAFEDIFASYENKKEMHAQIINSIKGLQWDGKDPRTLLQSWGRLRYPRHVLQKSKSTRQKQIIPKSLIDSRSLKFIVSLTLHDRTTKSLLHLHKKKKPPSISAQFQTSLSKLMETLGRAEPFFIRCIRSNAEKECLSNACDSTSIMHAGLVPCAHAEAHVGRATPLFTGAGMEMQFDEALVLQQLRYTGMLETVRIRRSGYSAKYTFQEFIEQFRVLLPKSASPAQEDLGALFKKMGWADTHYQIGKTKVFMQEAERQELQDTLHKEVMRKIVFLQRWFHARLERMQFLRMRQAAVTIQRAWRAYQLQVRCRAATIIQAVWRGSRQRQAYWRQRQGIRRLQAVVRGHSARRRCQSLREEKSKREEEARAKAEEEARAKAEAEAAEEARRQARKAQQEAEEQQRLEERERQRRGERDGLEEKPNSEMEGGEPGEGHIPSAGSAEAAKPPEPAAKHEEEKRPPHRTSSSQEKRELRRQRAMEHSQRELKRAASGSSGADERPAPEPPKARGPEGPAGAEGKERADSRELDQYTFVEWKVKEQPARKEGRGSPGPARPSSLPLDSPQPERNGHREPGSPTSTLQRYSKQAELRDKGEKWREKMRGEGGHQDTSSPEDKRKNSLQVRYHKRRLAFVRSQLMFKSAEVEDIEYWTFPLPPISPGVPLTPMRPKPPCEFRLVTVVECGAGAARAGLWLRVDLLLGPIETTPDGIQASTLKRRRVDSPGLQEAAHALQPQPVTPEPKSGFLSKILRKHGDRRPQRDPQTPDEGESTTPQSLEAHVTFKIPEGKDRKKRATFVKSGFLSKILRKHGDRRPQRDPQTPDEGESTTPQSLEAHVTFKIPEGWQQVWKRAENSAFVLSLFHERVGNGGAEGVSDSVFFFSPVLRCPLFASPPPPAKRKGTIKISRATRVSEQWNASLDRQISNANELRHLDEFLGNQVNELRSKGKQLSGTELIFITATTEFRKFIKSMYSLQKLQMGYKGLMNHYKMVVHTQATEKQKESEVHLVVNLFQSVLDGFIRGEMKREEGEQAKPAKAQKKKRRKKDKFKENYMDHIFNTYQVNIMQSCDQCNSFIWGMEKAYMCTMCKMVCHKKCVSKLQTSCSFYCAKKSEEESGSHFGVRVCALTSSKNPVPAVLSILLEHVEMNGLYTEGIYRKSGSANRMKELHQLLESDPNTVVLDNYPIHAVTGIVKQWLRELPDPLMTFEHYSDFLRAVELPEKQEQIQAIYKVLDQLPPANYNTLERLIFHLVAVAKHEQSNRMSPNALAIVFAPCILRCPDSADPFTSMKDVAKTTICVELILNEQIRKYNEKMEEIEQLEEAEALAQRQLKLKRQNTRWLVPLRFSSPYRGAVVNEKRSSDLGVVPENQPTDSDVEAEMTLMERIRSIKQEK
ncbi:MYO9B protein, partial [Atractosteus spatula]|nr:MYO9B protein [Atractosteus spatula]